MHRGRPRTGGDVGVNFLSRPTSALQEAAPSGYTHCNSRSVRWHSRGAPTLKPDHFSTVLRKNVEWTMPPCEISFDEIRIHSESFKFLFCNFSEILIAIQSTISGNFKKKCAWHSHNGIFLGEIWQQLSIRTFFLGTAGLLMFILLFDSFCFLSSFYLTLSFYCSVLLFNMNYLILYIKKFRYF